MRFRCQIADFLNPLVAQYELDPDFLKILWKSVRSRFDVKPTAARLCTSLCTTKLRKNARVLFLIFQNGKNESHPLGLHTCTVEAPTHRILC